MKTIFSVKNVMRVLTTLLLIFVFCPTFLVSCSNQTLKVGVMQAVGGVKVNGEKVSGAHPIMLLCLLLPIAIFVILTMKKFAEKMASLIVLGASVLDFIMWVSFKSATEKEAAKNYCAFDITAVYMFNMIAIIALIVLSLLVLVGKLQLENGFKLAGGSAKLSGAEQQKIETRSAAQAPQMKFCSECGAKLTGEATFCGSCGTKVE